MPHTKRWTVAGAFLAALLFAPAACAAEKSGQPSSLTELQAAIENVLQKTSVPAAGVALVSRNEVLWTAGLGLADVARRTPAGPDTLFRIGSISKTFVALAALKLVEQGRLDLDARVRELVPGIEFTNPWEETNPVRFVHLLEHTTGFDDVHLREYARSGRGLSLRQGLDFHPDSRTARWPPGSYFSYCNSGPAVAAYAIEKIAGQAFEDSIRENFFGPLEMPTAGYFLTEEAERKLARGYRSDGAAPFPYWHILMPPAGAINASPQEMAHFVQLFLNRGSFRGTRLLSPESIQRMETPRTTLAARAGIPTGYGLGLYTHIERGFRFYGHDGGIGGYLASFGYLPEEGLGYSYMINAGNGRAFEEIGKLIRGYLTSELAPPSPPAPAAVPAERLRSLSGYYEPLAPRMELNRFFLRLTGIIRVDASGIGLRVRPLFRRGRELLPVTEQQFRGPDDPLPTAIFVEQREGELIFQDTSAAAAADLAGGGSYRRVPAALVWAQWLAAVAVLGLMTSALSTGLFWFFGRLHGRLRHIRHWRARLLPLGAVLSLYTAFAILLLSMDEARVIWRFGERTAWSVSYYVLTLLFAALALAGLLEALRLALGPEARSAWLYPLLISTANVTALAYLGYWGMIGLRTWAY